MKKTTFLAALALLAAGPALAAGWSDGEIRAAAEGPGSSVATPVASMPKPDSSNPMPMGLTAFPVSTKATDLAAEISEWEASKERHGPVSLLEDRKWKIRPTHERYVEIGHPVEKDLPKHLVHDLHEERRHGHDHGDFHPGYSSDSRSVLTVHQGAYEEDGGDVGYGPRRHASSGHGHDGGHSSTPDHRHEGHAPKSGETAHHRLEIDVDLRDNCGSICWYEITRP